MIPASISNSPTDFLLIQEYGNVDGISLPWLGYKRFLLPSELSYFDEENCHMWERLMWQGMEGGHQPTVSKKLRLSVQHPTEELNAANKHQVSLEEILPQSKVQMRLQILSQHLNCSLVRVWSRGPSYIMLDSWPKEIVR